MGWIEGKAFDASNATVNEFDIPLSEGPAPKTIEGFPEKLEMWRERDGFEAPVFFRYGQDLEMVSNEEPCVQGEYDDEMFAHRRLSCHWPC